MAQIDLASLEPGKRLFCDVCIVGSGPAGATIARELSNTKLEVIVLESGGTSRNADVDELNKVENVGAPRVEDQWLVRNRIVGGSSHTWSGRCIPFDAIDLEPRDWVPHSGWPFEISRLARHLDRAAAYLDISPATQLTDAGGADAALRNRRFWEMIGRPRPEPELNSDILLPCFWQFSRPPHNRFEHTRFGPRLPNDIGANVTLITNATVLAVVENSAATAVNSVEIVSLDGERRTVAAKFIVLCAGGIENARILLCSEQAQRLHLGKAYSVVGRFLMDHVRGPVATFPVKGTERLRKRFGHYYARKEAGGHVFCHGVQLSAQTQRKEGLLNCAAWLEGEIASDDPWNAMKRLMGKAPSRVPLRDATIITANLGLVANGLRDHFIERNGLRRKIDRLNLICMVEQQPDPDSRVTLAETRDRFGLPIARIDWRINEAEHRTMRRMTELVASEFERVGLQRPAPEPWVTREDPFPDHFRDVAHPTGTTRMGDDPATSVVDHDCQVHGISGLYIAGSSIFPTSSHANPTQMIVALAIRLADTIRLRLGAGEKAAAEQFETEFRTGAPIEAATLLSATAGAEGGVERRPQP